MMLPCPESDFDVIGRGVHPVGRFFLLPFSSPFITITLFFSQLAIPAIS